MSAADLGRRGWLTVLASTVLLVALVVWLFGTGTVELVFGLVGVLAVVLLVVLAVVGAVVERQPGCVLVSLAFLGVGALLTAVVFGFAYLGETLTYLRGTPTTAEITECEDDEGPDDDCLARWRVGGREHTGEIEISFAQQPGDTVPVHADGPDAVRAGGLTTLVVAAGAVAVLSPFAAGGAFLYLRHRRSSAHRT